MAKIRWHRSYSLCILALWLTGCSQAEIPGPSNEVDGAEHEFSLAEREAASVLAIGADVAAEDQNIDPFDQALRCQSALTTVREKLGNSDGFDNQHQAAFAEADRLFARLVRETGREAGRTPAEIDSALRSATGTPRAADDQARTALGCLQKLLRPRAVQQG